MHAINNSVITILVQSQISLILGGKGKEKSWRCGDKLRNVIIFDSAATEVKAIISQCPD